MAKRKKKARLELTLTRSYIGCKPKQRATLRALGLRRIGHSVIKEDTPSIRGMVASVEHLVSICEAE